MNSLNSSHTDNLALQTVTVTTTARLHMGFVDLNGSQTRMFGSLGVALDAPKTQLTIVKSKKTLIEAKSSEYVAKILENLKSQLKIDSNFIIKLDEAIPEHAGLGSGTQLALAIGVGINALLDLNLSTAQLAAITGRGRRSGIGIGTFDLGGLVLDGGRNALHPQKMPPIIARHAFPTQWPILLIMDHTDQGVFGDAEIQAFETLPPANFTTAQALSHHILMQALPAVVEQDYPPFAQAIFALQSATGEYFSAAQGGHYKSAKVAEVLDYLNAQGIICAGQSSWGPTGFAIFDNETYANAMLNQLRQQFPNSLLQFQLMRAKNSGANIYLS